MEPQIQFLDLAKQSVRLDHANPAHTDTVVVNWCVGNTCNYACRYCPEDLHSASVKFPDLKTVTDFCDKVLNHYRDKKLYFEFTGGEVTLWKELIPLSMYLKERGAKIGIISNGSRALDWWEKNFSHFDHVCLSFHPASAKVDHFCSVAKLISPHLRTHINLMMDPEQFEKCLEAAEIVKDIPDISLALQPLIVDFGSQLYDYTSEQKQILDRQGELYVKKIPRTKEHEYFRGAMTMVMPDGKKITRGPQHFVANQANTWLGWDCYVGVEQIVVAMNGDILRGWCQVGGVIGKIGSPDIEFPTRPVRCNKEMCHCNLDIMATKIKR